MSAGDEQLGASIATAMQAAGRSDEIVADVDPFLTGNPGMEMWWRGAQRGARERNEGAMPAAGIT
jgi:hypothetical protein